MWGRGGGEEKGEGEEDRQAEVSVGFGILVG